MTVAELISSINDDADQFRTQLDAWVERKVNSVKDVVTTAKMEHGKGMHAVNILRDQELQYSTNIVSQRSWKVPQRPECI